MKDKTIRDVLNDFKKDCRGYKHLSEIPVIIKLWMTEEVVSKGTMNDCFETFLNYLDFNPTSWGDDIQTNSYYIYI